jgi:hypothetical protein
LTVTDDFRRINDHRRLLFQDAKGQIAFLCECEDTACTRSVLLAPVEFDAARAREQQLLHEVHAGARA